MAPEGTHLTDQHESGRSEMPPRWADALLRALLPPEDRDSISGDLLEEYRESTRPALGSRRANVWYVRQVGWYLGRASLPWGGLIGAALVVRYVVDVVVPVSDYRMRSTVLSDAIVATYLLAAFKHSWRTRRFASGLIVAVAAAAIAGVISSAGLAAVLATWHDPRTLATMRASGGLEEGLIGVPLLLFPIGIVVGTVGALLGKIVGTMIGPRNVHDDPRRAD